MRVTLRFLIHFRCDCADWGEDWVATCSGILQQCILEPAQAHVCLLACVPALGKG